MLSKLIDSIYICTDSKKIGHEVVKHNCKVIYTGKNPTGTDRISEASLKLKKKYDVILILEVLEHIEPSKLEKTIKYVLKYKYRRELQNESG